jgi:hypothetical protein
MKSNDLELRTIFPTGLICGLLGGGCLVLVTIMPIKGWWVIPVLTLISNGRNDACMKI